MVGGRVQRLFVFSLPDLTWAEMRTAPMPNLRGFLRTAAVANLAPARMVSHRAGPGDAYLTFSAGTRAVGHPDVDGAVFAQDAVLGSTTAGAASAASPAPFSSCAQAARVLSRQIGIASRKA